VNAEVLLTRLTVKDGRLCLPAPASAPGVETGDGLRYRYLVLCEPQCRTLTPAVLEKIRDLVKAGATLVGRPPETAPGLTDRNAAAARVGAVTAGLWGDPTAAAGERKFGAGRVIWGKPMADIMRADGVRPDLVSLERIGSRAGLAGASWIWHAADGANPPPCVRLFRTAIDIPEGRAVASARVSMTADNGFVLSLNGKEICRGDDFNQVIDSDIDPSLLHAGRNEISVRAVNGGDAPNPAGLIGRLVIALDDGRRIERKTEAESWMSSVDGAAWAAAGVEGPLGCGPWGAVDHDSEPLAWIHRRLRGREIYFLSNPNAHPVDASVTLRAKAKSVRLFDPLDGTVHSLPEHSATSDGRTNVPLHFEADQALFLVAGNVESAAGGRGPAKNFPAIAPVLDLAGPWQVGFDASWVKPLPPGIAPGAKEVVLRFEQLKDWTQRPEAGINAYSGMAVYRKRFDLPARAASGKPESHPCRWLDLGRVGEMARVLINGRGLGVAWCPPWRVRIPSGLLKQHDNELVIMVANTWNNRLCADNALPVPERLTRVGHNLHERAAKQGYQPAGLMGPVRVMAEQ